MQFLGGRKLLYITILSSYGDARFFDKDYPCVFDNTRQILAFRLIRK